MNIKDIAKEYYTELDEYDKNMIDKRVAEKGIEQYLNQQLVYLDCSRIINGMRMMQTIGYPYKREITSYIYVLINYKNNIEGIEDWINILEDRHTANLEYEKENPPIWYDKPKKGTKRKQKTKQGDLFPEETKKAKMSKAEAKLKAKLLGTNIGFGTIKLKI